MADDASQPSNEPVDSGTTSTDSAPVETTTPPADSSPVQRDNGELIYPKATEEETSDDKPETSEETEPAEQQDSEQLAPKSQNRFQTLANENRELKEQLETLRRQESQLATEQELLNEINPETGQYYTPQEIERLSFAQSREQQAEQVASERYELEVQTVQSTLRNEASQALQDFPMFDETSKQYNPELAKQVDDLLGENLVFETDSEGNSTGRIIGSSLSPYKLYQTVAQAAQLSKQAGQLEGQKATERMLASVDGTGSNQQGDVDFSKLSVSDMAARLRRAGHDV
jgi:hypothetical protein